MSSRREGEMQVALRLEVGCMQTVMDGGTVRAATYQDDHTTIGDAECEERPEQATTLPEMVRSVVAQANEYLTQLNDKAAAKEYFELKGE